MHLGLAPLISQPSELRMIKSLFRDYHGPREFLTQVKVQQLITSFSSMLWPNNNGLLIDVSLVQTIDEKLDEILDEQKSDLSTHNTECADFTDFTILTAKLHMYAAIVTRAPGDSTSRSIILKMGLGAALRIIDLAQSIVPRPATATVGAGGEGSQNNTAPQPELSREECQRALSKKHFLAIVFAVVFLLRYFSLNSAAPADERQRAANHVLAARGLFRSWSLDPRDEYARAAVLFETLCRQAPSPARAGADDDPQQKPRATDRMGVSILFDAISTAQELRKVSVEPSEKGQATWPTDGLDDTAAAASSSNDKNSDDLPTRIVERGKGVATGGEDEEAASRREEAATSRVDVPAFYFESDMDVTTAGQGGGFEGGFPPRFWDNPMWDVFNFDFEAAASGEYAGDHFL
ncbi:hypothetical protein PG999_002419 [Apiospora kogelbergensis]|uniref:Uncharacterized protein n=1 Tax=Apiospora kogelbergensis TaxID=1337665 RepID=A0AAW0R8A6_9PEZI